MIASRPRTGVTLVELLVVIALIILLAGLSVAFNSTGMFNSQKVVSGADRVSGWLLISKSRAKRDQLPRGVRFLLKPVRNPMWSPSPQDQAYFTSTEAQYIESPQPWVPNANPGDPTPVPSAGAQPTPTGPRGPRIAFVYYHRADNVLMNDSTHRQVHFTTDPSRIGPGGDFDEFAHRVATNDHLVLPGLNRTCRITGISDSTVNIGGNPHPSKLLNLDDADPATDLRPYPDLGANNSGVIGSPPNACRVEHNFAFQPTARPLLGEPSLQLTRDVVIDCRLNPIGPILHPTPTTMGVIPVSTPGPDGLLQYHFDVLFVPDGGAMYAPGGLVCLWVRDPEKTHHPRWDYSQGANGQDAESAYDSAGEQSLVVVRQNGSIVTEPPAFAGPPPRGTGGDPYRYAKENKGGGL